MNGFDNCMTFRGRAFEWWINIERAVVKHRIPDGMSLDLVLMGRRELALTKHEYLTCPVCHGPNYRYCPPPTAEADVMIAG